MLATAAEATWSGLAREIPLEVLSRGVVGLMGANDLSPPAARRFAEYARSLLTPEFVGPLQAALLEAFPTQKALADFARRGLGEGAEDRPSRAGETPREAVARLVGNFVESGRFEELVTRALTWAPKSQKIQALAAAMDVPTVPRPTSGSRFRLGSVTPRWTAAMIDELVSALTDAFDFRSLQDLLRAVGEARLDAVTPGGRPPEIVRDVVLWADARGRLEDLVAEALKVRPDHRALAKVARSAKIMAAGLSGSPPPAEEAIDPDAAAIRLRPVTFMDIEAWMYRLQALQATVCRIAAGSPPSASATGFLIGPGIVMTSAACLGASGPPVGPVHIAFEGPSGRPGRTYEMATDGVIDRDEELGVALFRVAGQPEADPVEDRPSSPARGWLSLVPTRARVLTSRS